MGGLKVHAANDWIDSSKSKYSTDESRCGRIETLSMDSEWVGLD
jgi:hypothetical protein